MLKFQRQADKSYTSTDGNYTVKKLPNGVWMAYFQGEKISSGFTLSGAKMKASEHAAK